MTPSLPRTVTRWRHGAGEASSRVLADEVAVAITHNRETHAVMMATPADIEDFAVGFSLTEGVIDDAAQIEELEVLEVADGIEARMWLAPDRAAASVARRRRLAGPTGCGLCGIDSLAEAVRPPRPVSGTLVVTPAMIREAQSAMDDALPLGRETRAVHAAGLWHPVRGLLAVREDVGRHNALDKLVGASARQSFDATACVLLLSSRVSIEMVQKACVLGAPVVVAISAPTAHAVRLADEAGLTLVAVARADGFEVFTGARTRLRRVCKMVEQQVALVTGANKGIGLEIARQLAERGYMVWMGARDAGRGQAAADTLGQERLVRFISLDVTDELSIIAAAAMIEHESGRLDVLVNNAGIAIDGGAAPSALSTHAMRTTFDVNVFAPVRITQAFLPLLRAAPAGRIVMVSSGLGSMEYMSNPKWPFYGVNLLAYNTSKAALNAITVAFAKELAGTPIKINAANPGYTATDLNGNSGTQTVAEGAEAAVRLATLPDDGPTGQFFSREGPEPW